jgi:hypothetical protein
VQWYFCPAGAKAFPGAHNFPSGNWYKGTGVGDAPIGELEAVPRPWRNGSRPSEAKGLQVCVPAGDFITGLPYLLTPRPSYADGFPSCCNAPPPSGVFLDYNTPTLWPCAVPFGPLHNTVTWRVRAFLTNHPGWTPYIGVSYVLTRDLSQGPPTWTNPGAGGGLGVNARAVCTASPPAYFAWAGPDFPHAVFQPAFSVGAIVSLIDSGGFSVWFDVTAVT